MKYLCLLYHDEAAARELSKGDLDAGFAEYAALNAALQQSGHYVASNALQPSHAATLVRVRDGKLSTTDGPFAETKEQLGGYLLIEAPDLNAAIQVAGRIPGARYGTVEVRPILERPRS